MWSQNLAFYVACLFFSIAPSQEYPSQVTYSAHNISHTSAQNIDELIKKQTETVKYIVSNQANSNLDHLRSKPGTIAAKPAPVTKTPGPSHVITKPHQPVVAANHKPADEVEKFTLEELKIKCQHLANLAAANKSEEGHNENHHPLPQNHKISPTITGHYITTKAGASTTHKAIPSTTPLPARKPVQNVKFIKLEPVILQKTVLNDGRTIYYWLKSLPTSLQYSPNVQPVPPTPTTPYTTTTTTTTTTTPRSSYNFRNFFPFYTYGGDVESTTTAPTTTEKTATTQLKNENDETNDQLTYQQQLKFVVPLPYNDEDGSFDGDGKKQPWEFDPLAYYPKPLQPETMNVQVPYVPTFHVIKAVAIPNQYEIPQSGEYNKPLDNVNVS